MQDKIFVNKDICHGKPCIQGTRIMVWQILDLLENGCTFNEIIKDYFPQLTKEDIQACIHYASTLIKNEDVCVFDTLTSHGTSR